MVEKLVPKLRFNEFHDGWNTIFLNNILSFKNGFNASKDQYGFGTKFINVSDILENNYLTYDNIQDYVNVDENELSNYIIEYGDIVFQRSSENREEVGTANVYLGSQPCVYGGFVIRGKKEGNYNPFFLKELLQSTRVRKEITSWSGGSTRYNIGQDSLNKISVSLPSIEEQNKIADLLLKVYEKIDLLNYKFQCYNNFKKYLMQQIFTQKLRFDFNDDWKKYKLKDLLSVKSSSISINQLDDNTGDYPLYGASGFLKNIDFCEMDVDYISIVKDGSGVGNLSYHEQNSSIVNTSQYLLPKKDFNIYFLYYLLQTLNLKKYINGSSIPHIYFKDYCIEKVNIPSLSEQNHIGRLFLDIDKMLENLRNNIELTNEFKKSLLQQMFISILINSLSLMKYVTMRICS